jgi:hypothetical protein
MNGKRGEYLLKENVERMGRGDGNTKMDKILGTNVGGKNEWKWEEWGGRVAEKTMFFLGFDDQQVLISLPLFLSPSIFGPKCGYGRRMSTDKQLQ